MKTKYYYFIFFFLILLSCSKQEEDSCAVNIQVTLPENTEPLSYQGIEVTLTHKDLGNTYKAYCSPAGIATFQVENGFYTVSAHFQTTSGVIFNGRIESLSLLPGQTEITENLELSRSTTNALVIKEIYYAGCTGNIGEEYQSDQYITLYNNSDETVYLDGLCIAVVDPASRLESPWMKYTDMKRIPVNDLTWQFPGNGNEYPLTPGAETTIATNAVDHTGGEYQQANSIDLSKVDWGFWDVSLRKQNITPGVKPLKLISKLNPSTLLYSFPPIGPTIMVFKINDTDPESFVNNPKNREPRPESSNQNKVYLMIPKEWVLDCTECAENADRASFKHVPGDLDNGTIYIPDAPYTGKSVIRKKVTDANNNPRYQDTNNSTNDMEVSLPTLKKK